MTEEDSRLVAGEERELYASRPSVWYALLASAGWLLVLALIGVGTGSLWYSGRSERAAEDLTLGIIILGVLVVVARMMGRAASEFVLTDRRVVWRSGVLRRLTVEAPLTNVQHVVMYQRIRERLFGLGTIGIATAGTDAIEIVWTMVADPERVLGEVRRAVDAAGGRALPSGEPVTNDPGVPAESSKVKHGLPVIGLAGGIGAGKSTVAGILAQLGCVVIDSDARAKAALDRPEVRGQLVGWWGPGILGEDGRVERSRVARIVFARPEERARLEALVHPIVRQDRAAMAAEAADAGALAVVVDAPLLYEAGVDRECDRVLFVDAPRSVRLERVLRTRGWDAAELERREAAQIPATEKRSRADEVVLNDSTPKALEPRVKAALDRMLKSVGGPGRANAD